MGNRKRNVGESLCPIPHGRPFSAGAAPSGEEVRQGMAGGASLGGACDLRSVVGGGLGCWDRRWEAARTVCPGAGATGSCVAVGLETTLTPTSRPLLE